MRPLLFDASALMPLFRGQGRVSALWFDAEAVGVSILIPATAIAEANRELNATDNAWTALLFAVNVYALDLSPAAALGASRHHGDPATAHASHEAAHRRHHRHRPPWGLRSDPPRGRARSRPVPAPCRRARPHPRFR